MANLPGLRGEVYFGDVGAPLPDWRQLPDSEPSDDDTPSPEEWRTIVGMLGFDPREIDEDDEALTLATDAERGGGHWITIGGHANEEEGTKHSGGVRVFVKDGKILWGRIPEAMRGTQIRNFRKNIRAVNKDLHKKGVKPAASMKRNDWKEHLEEKGEKKRFGKSKHAVDVAHRESVRQAVKEGRPVSDDALADYPDLKERKKKQPSAAAPAQSEVKHGGEGSGQSSGVAERGGSQSNVGQAPADGTGVANATGRSSHPEHGEKRTDADQPARRETAARVPAQKQEVMRRLDRFEQFFRSRGQHEAADWMGMVRQHVDDVGTDEALRSLGEQAGKGNGEQTRYEGEEAGWEDMSDFGKSYLDRYGIVSTHDAGRSKKIRTVSSLSKEFGGKGGKGHSGDFQPQDPTFLDKLEESKLLPGLESSEDINKIMGRPVTHLTQDVLDKMDERYGKDSWIIKTFGDSAFAGKGIFFAQRAAQIRRDARAAIWDSGAHLAQYGFSHMRDKNGRVIGIQHSGGDKYKFGTEKYEHTIHGDARHWADRAAQAAANEEGAELPFGGKDFMAQPAFPVVGVSNEERARGVTIKKGSEGRTHIVTRNGRADLIPHTTWLKGPSGEEEPLPVVFEDDDTRALAQAAVDAINALPESERQGQLYAPDIVRTADGYRVVEVNPSDYSGPSGYLGDNPFVIDSYVSHLTGREPAHVRFIRRLLSKRKR